MRVKRKIALGTVMMLSVLLCFSGCGKKKKNAKLETGDVSSDSVVMLVGNEAVRFSELQTYCYFLKCQYEGSFGSELWDYPLGESETIGDQAKQEIVNMIVQLKIITAKAEEQNIQLTADEQDEALQHAEAMMDNAKQKDKKKYTLSVQEISEIYQENALATKMFYIATDDADTNVSDAEARQVSLQYLQVMTNGTNRNGREIAMDETAKAEALERAKTLKKAADQEEDFLSFAQKNTDAAQAELIIGTDTDKLEQKAVETAFSMKKGETSGVIEGENGYYIIHCVEERDEEATYQRKEEIIEERQTTMFMEKYADWMKDKKVDINQNFWNDFSI